MKRILIPAACIVLVGSLWLTAAAATPLAPQPAHEVNHGSLPIPTGAHDQAHLAKLARVNRTHAEAAALVAHPGQILQSRLENEEGFLVWQVDVKDANAAMEVSIDAGDGTVLAVEREEADDEVSEDAAD